MEVRREKIVESFVLKIFKSTKRFWFLDLDSVKNQMMDGSTI